jgi:hypothetical protein
MNLERMRSLVNEGLATQFARENARLATLTRLAEAEKPTAMKADDPFRDERDAKEVNDPQKKVEAARRQRARARTEDEEPEVTGGDPADTSAGRGDQAAAFSDEMDNEEIPNDFEGYIEYALGATAPEGTPPEELEGMVDVLIQFADQMAETGELPPFPGEEATPEEKAAWVGSAKLGGFIGRFGEYKAEQDSAADVPPETPPDMGDSVPTESRRR